MSAAVSEGSNIRSDPEIDEFPCIFTVDQGSDLQFSASIVVGHPGRQAFSQVSFAQRRNGDRANCCLMLAFA